MQNFLKFKQNIIRKVGRYKMEKKNQVSPSQRIKNVVHYLFKIKKREKTALYLGYVCSLLIGIVQPVLNMILPKYIINELSGDKQLKELLMYVGILIIGNAILLFLANFMSSMKKKYGDSYNRILEEQLSDKVMAMNYQNTEEPYVLEMLQKSKQALEFSEGLTGIFDSFEAAATSVGLIVASSILLITGAPWIMLVICITVFFHCMFGKKQNEIQIEYFQKNADFNRCFEYIHWKLSDIRYGKDIRLYDALDLMIEKVNYYNDELSKRNKEQAYTTRKLMLGDSMISLLQNTLVYTYLGINVCMKKISLGGFSMYISAANLFSQHVNALVISILDVVKKCYFFNEYIAFLSYAEDSIKDSGKEIVKVKEHFVIEFKDVSYQYPNTSEKVLEHFNLRLDSNKKLAIVGLNGVGKTTFIKLLVRLYEPTEGEILLNGINIKEYDYESYTKLFSAIFQDFKLFAFSMEENITLGKKAAGQEKKVQDVVKMAGLSEKIEKLEKGIETTVYKFFDEEGVEPSGGEQQKIAIARALYQNAPIIILDEPTAALDPIAEEEVFQKFNQLVGNRTAIYISHRLSSCKFCDEIAVFYNKKVSEYGTHEELMRKENGLYCEMFSKQAEYYQ